jgi:tight adherence protein B
MKAFFVGACVALGLLCAAAAIVLARRDARTPRSSGSSSGSRSTSPFIRSLIAAVAGALVGRAIAGGPGLVILGTGLAAAPTLVARRRAARHVERYEEQLLDLVAALGSATRSGRSLEQALSMAASELPEPLGPSLAAVVDRVELGASLDAALDDWARELRSADARLVVGVLRMHRRTGGALAGPLDDLATTLRARRAGARELRSLTAQARLSAAILGLLPVGFFLFLSVVSRRDIEEAIATPAGLGAIGVGVTLQASAFVWIRSLLRVDDA